MPATFFIPLSAGERFDIGRDTGVTVADYATPTGKLDGEVRHFTLTLD
ncbi:MAG: hypothetical protein P8J20_07015 [Novosphingobium sp.]|nr:hypothetical protein [Novosphingobium sp.]